MAWCNCLGEAIIIIASPRFFVWLWLCMYMQNVILFSPDGSEGDYNEETELFEQECDDFMKEFVAKIFLKE